MNSFYDDKYSLLCQREILDILNDICEVYGEIESLCDNMIDNKSYVGKFLLFFRVNDFLKRTFSDRVFDGNFVKRRYIHVFCEKCIKSTSNLLTFDIVFSIILVGTFFLYSPFYRTWEIL